ncbi:MAG: DUF4492 domain-containing protein [Prevotellaceae bacterium]|jgi:hypothetical protein|nr:DUF4492 domain-containing protein [Prevotellaceae bacterium]
MNEAKGISAFFKMYIEGIKNMTWGKTLWILVLIKLFVMFAVLKIFFFPNFLNGVADNEKGKAEYVAKQLTE